MNLIPKLWNEITNFSWTGVQSSSPYDTAWVSSLADDQNKPIFPDALTWTLQNQHKDGSWGLKNPYFFICEQMTATLASLRSLNGINKEKYKPQIDNGVNWVNENIKIVDQFLKKETLKTVGFELLFPSLLNSLNSKLEFSFDTSSFNFLMDSKLKKLPLSLITFAKTPLLFSIEFLNGLEQSKKANLDQLITSDGSLSSSPSATAFYASQKPKTFEYLLNYLIKSQNLDGGWPAFKNGGLFSTAYSLYIIQKALGYIPQRLRYLISFLQLNWNPLGIGVSETFCSPDMDDTALALKIFSDNHFLTPRTELAYWNAIDTYFNEDKGYFLTVQWENDPSFLVNLHILDALRSNKVKKRQYFDRVLNFLAKEINANNSFPIDKYHYSTFLENSRAIIILSDIDKSLAGKLLDKLLKSQREDGLWGTNPNVEELAQVVAALSYYNLHVEKIDLTILDMSIKFIFSHISDIKNQSLWIAKSLYNPIEVVTTNVYTSLFLYEQAQQRNRIPRLQNFVGLVNNYVRIN